MARLGVFISFFITRVLISGAYPDSEGDCGLTVFVETMASGGKFVPTKATRQQCEDHCLFYPTCWGYDWTENSTSCAIHEKSTYDQRNGQNGTVHIEIGETCKKNKRAVYLGCFKHDHLYMAVKAGTVEGKQYMYTQLCVQRCSALNFRYAATEVEDTCWCGDQFHQDGGIALDCVDISTLRDCGGDPNDKCGHDDRMMVYEVYPRPWLNGPDHLQIEELGCYTDLGGDGSRDLPVFMGQTWVGWNGLSHAFCAGLCASAGYQYAGLQLGLECFCGNSYGKDGTTSGCEQCRGDTLGKLCGRRAGNTVLNISSVDLVEDPPFTELGCFDEHDADDFLLEWNGISQDRTPETCIYYCYNAGMRYAAMHRGNCYCGGVYGTYRKVTDNLCNHPCHDLSPGDLNCGGYNHDFYIYQLGENHCSISGDDAVWNKMYVGCWEDKNVNTMFDRDDDNSRDFEVYIAVSSQPWNGMTLNRCVPACVTLGYRYAALQGTRCFCGNSYGRHRPIDEAECRGDSRTCGGDLKGVCGQHDKSAVYDTSLGDLRNCSRSYGRVDECVDGTHNCDGNATCYDTPTSFICHCNANYNGTGEQGQCHQDCDLEEIMDTRIAGSSGQVIDFYVSTKEECLAYCVNETTCWGLEWVETSKSCIIFTADEINNTVSRSGSVLVKVGPFCIWKRRSKHLGCYLDLSHRILPAKILESYDYVHMTPELCVARFAAWNFRYAGLQNHRDCYCGDLFNTEAKASPGSNECNRYCFGDPNVMCGRVWRNSVYEIFPLTFDGGPVSTTAPTYLGCYYWNNGGSNMAGDLISRLMTPTVCAAACKTLGYSKAALRDHQQCKCGEAVGDQKDLSLCDRVCFGDAVSKCGRDLEHSVYDTQSTALPSYLEDPKGVPENFYYGCFSFEDQAFRDVKINLPSPSRTIETCIRLCAAVDATFAGMRDGSGCFCSGALEKASRREEADCNQDCEDDPVGNKRNCGGSSEIFSVWRLGWNYCPFKSDDPLMSRMYIGCYKDQNIYSAELRDIDEFINQQDYWKDVTLPRCLGACATLGYTIGAIALGNRCFCGHTYGRYGLHSNQNVCNNPCKGDNRGVCGASDVNAVYNLTALGPNVVPCSRGPPIDECSLELHECNTKANSSCVDTKFYYKCECNPGFRENDASVCEEIDECLEYSPCGHNATCTDLLNSYNCSCPEGYYGGITPCFDVDECESELHNCDGNATCTNLEATFSCACNTGFRGNGILGNCTEIDECTENIDDCDNMATCMNTVGSFTCTCKDGYQGPGNVCNDIDECTDGTHNCDVNGDCTNQIGNFTCSCKSGFTGSGTTGNCTDIDECSSDVDDCHNDANCTNTAGSFTCTCREGYTGNGTACSEIDECSKGTHNCDPHASCSNSPFPYSCACNSGYTGDGFSCIDLTDECGLGTHNCDTNALCINNNVSFSCQCLSGYNGTGTNGTCSDINECLGNTYICDVLASCVNSAGSYRCQCANGFVGDGTPGNCKDSIVKSGYYKKSSESASSLSDGLACIAQCMDSTDTGTCQEVKINSDGHCLFNNGDTGSPAIANQDFYAVQP